MDTLIQKRIFKIMQINIFQGDLTDILAEKEALFMWPFVLETVCFSWCSTAFGASDGSWSPLTPSLSFCGSDTNFSTPRTLCTEQHCVQNSSYSKAVCYVWAFSMWPYRSLGWLSFSAADLFRRSQTPKKKRVPFTNAKVRQAERFLSIMYCTWTIFSTFILVYCVNTVYLTSATCAAMILF